MMMDSVRKTRGCAVICGAAPSIFDDLAEAKRLRPGAKVLGVNHVASMVDGVRHIWTQHQEKAPFIRATTKTKIKIHAREAGEDIDYVWPELHWVLGSSGLGAAMWAKYGLGYSEVILAGIPLDPGQTQYSDSYQHKHQFAPSVQIAAWKRHLEIYQEDGKTEGIFSMSGSTRSILGAPKG